MLGNPKLAAKTARRRYRAALPSALMGLVAFSFTLLFFGAAVYTAALPSMVESAKVTYQEVAQEREEEAAEQAEEGADAEAAAGESSQVSENDTLTLGGASGTGISLSGASSATAGDLKTDSGSTSTDKKNSASSSKTDSSANKGSSASGGSSSNSGNSGNSGTTLDQEKEQELYDFLYAKAEALPGYVDQVNACVQTFNNDALAASQSTRASDQTSCEALYTALFGQRAAFGRIGVQAGSQYTKQYNQLVGMYRCLSSYVDVINQSWTINIQYADPSAHVDEFMDPINSTAVNGENKYWTEFCGYYNGFTL